MKRKSTTTCILALLCTCLLAVAGCTGHAESFGAGVATGSAVTHTLQGAQADLTERQAALIAQRDATLDQLESTNEDVQRLDLQARVDALTRQLESATAAQTGITVGKRALATDWTDPDQAAPWILTGVAAVFGFLTDRKKRSLNQILTAVNEGVEKFKAQSDPRDADRLYDTIKDRKQLNGVQ
ncbi:MAG: hypothetical protein DRP56_06625 [Planctomycetota bacterium]|nr:MAG: hypothetical protein DRP56_06625 [Planctomycetota bacterium]